MPKYATLFVIATISLLLTGEMAQGRSSHAPVIMQPTIAASPCPPAWRSVPSVNPDPSYSTFSGVTAVSDTDVWAVGGTNSDSLIEHWDGASWSVVASAQTGGRLQAVTSITSSDVWAVGYSSSGALAEHWDGASWSIVPTTETVGSLYGVAAVAANDIWAVGWSETGTITLHWNGTQWNAIPNPSPTGYLSGVAAISSNDVWAVGNNGGHTLMEHWNGASWSIVPSPNPGALGNYPNKVSASASNDVWAVGYYANGGGSEPATLVEHWNGSNWSVIATPNPSRNGNGLSGVIALSATEAWAVGSSFETTLVEYWDGINWRVIPSPNPDPNSDSNHLYSVSALAPDNVWAVGDTYAGTHTLVEHYSSSGCTTSTPTPVMTGTPYTSTPVTTGTPYTSTPVTTGTPYTSTPQPTICANPFIDIQSNVFFRAINYLYCHAVVNGTDATHYSPAGTSTRGQFAKVVVLGFGLPSYTPATPDFSDVPSTYYAYTYIESGYHASILSGFDANTCAAHGVTYPCYVPNLAITRGQLTSLVVSAAHYLPYTPSNGQDFVDVPPTDVFFSSVETAYNKGVINGYTDSTFRSNNVIRRDEMAQIVFMALISP